MVISKTKKTITADKKSTLKSIREKPTKLFQSIFLRKKSKAVRPTKLVVVSLIAALLFLGIVKFRYLLVPATVNRQPIFIWTYLAKLNKVAGREVLNQLIAESLVIQEVEEKKVVVEPGEIDDEITKLEEELASGGGLEAFLTSQGSTRDQLRENIELSLKVKKLISEKVSVTNEEIDAYYSDNQEFYKDLSEVEAKKEIREDLQNQKIEQEFSLWLEAIRNKALIKIYLPGFNNVPQASN